MYILLNISAGPTAEASALTRFKTRAANGSNKPISPFLRAKQTNNTSVAVGSNPVEENKDTENANGNDVATKLSFKEEETNADSKADAETNVINGSIENESQKKVSYNIVKTSVAPEPWLGSFWLELFVKKFGSPVFSKSS